MLKSTGSSHSLRANSNTRSGSGGRRVYDIQPCATIKESAEKDKYKETVNATYEIVGVIGEGSFGKTYLAKIKDTKRLENLLGLDDDPVDTDTEPLSPNSDDHKQILSLLKGKSVVVKEIKKHRKSSENHPESLELHGRNLESMDIVKSISHIKICDHPFIARLLDSQYALTPGETPFEVYEYYAVGDCLSLIDGIRECDDKHKEATNLQSYVLFISIQVAEALSYLHENNFIHFDLKIDNVFIDEIGEAKLGDFGLAKPCKLKKSILNPYPYWNSRVSANVFMTIRWVAPEQLEEELNQIDHSVDWYSFGALIYQMLYEKLPFEEHRQKALDMQEASEKTRKRSFLKVWKNNTRPKVEDRPKINQRFKNFFYNLLSYDPNARLGKQGNEEVFQKIHSLSKDLDLHWFDTVNDTDTDKIRRIIRRREIVQPFRIRIAGRNINSR